MAADQLMSSYVGSGAHASRPASPNVKSGVAPVYYETDTTNTFIWTGSAWAQINGGGGAATLSVATKTTTYTISSSDDVILADATSAGFTVTLPTAVGWTKRITIKKVDSSANAVTVGTTSTQTIDGVTSRLLHGQFASITLISDNANWRVTEEDTPLTSAGDLLLGLANNDANRLAIGSTGNVLTVSGGTAAWAAPITGTTATAQLGADVTMTSANTYYDGPSVSLAAGTWLVTASVSAETSGGVGVFTAKLWDGTTVYASACTTQAYAASEPVQLTLSWVVAPGSTTTYKVSVACNNAGSAIKAAAVNNAVGNNVSSIVAVRIA